MNARFQLFTLALAGCVLLIPSNGLADDPVDTIQFAAPRMISAGSAILGEGRYYPSPVMQDMNGDGRLDLVVGDLIGKVTVAYATKADGRSMFAAEQPVMDRDGQQLKFQNW